MGDPDGRPALYLHGIPGSAVEAAPLDGPAGDAGIRLLAVDRPGIGLSTSQHGRRVVDLAADLVELARLLRLDRPAVLGYSGGGPYALACATRPDAFGPIAVAAGAPPIVTKADERLMDPTDRALTVLGRRAPWAGGVVLAPIGSFVRWFPGASLRTWTWGLPAADRAVLAGPDGLGRSTMADLGAVLRTSGRGVVEDERALADRWGFEPAEVVARVRWWHGADDRLVRPEAARTYAERLPDATFELVPAAGHLLLATVAPAVFAHLAGREAG